MIVLRSRRLKQERWERNEELEIVLVKWVKSGTCAESTSMTLPARGFLMYESLTSVGFFHPLFFCSPIENLAAVQYFSRTNSDSEESQKSEVGLQLYRTKPQRV
jgi:hypothetical protein